MDDRRKWRALHVVDDDYYESLEVTEQSNGTFIYVVCDNVATYRDPETAMNAANSVFSRLFPAHACGRLCRPWAERP